MKEKFHDKDSEIISCRKKSFNISGKLSAKFQKSADVSRKLWANLRISSDVSSKLSVKIQILPDVSSKLRAKKRFFARSLLVICHFFVSKSI